jgi:serine/threonine-protein kinase
MAGTDGNDRRLSTGGGLQFVHDAHQAFEADLVGRILGEYRIEALIGAGGMAFVFHGARIDQKFERSVAIKILPGESAVPRLRERFLEERKILASLNHKNIAQLYDAGETLEGWPYIVMELVHGEPIDHYCRSRALTIDAAVELLSEVASAVSFAHTHLIVHRDIKPSNILVDAHGHPKLLDFGIAKLTGDSATLTRLDHQRPFTPIYASPEQLLGDAVSIRSDVFQLGVLIYEVLTGHRLFNEQTPEEVILRAARRELPPLPPEVLKTVPAPLVAILRKCLQPLPENRYGYVSQLIEDLQRYLNGYPIQAEASSWLARLRLWVSRNRTPAIAGTVALASVVAIDVWSTQQLDAARREATERAEANEELLGTLSTFVGETYYGLVGTQGIPPRRGGELNPALGKLLEHNDRTIRTMLAQQPHAKGQLLRVQARLNRELGMYPEARTLLEEVVAVAESEELADLRALAYADLALTDVASDRLHDLDRHIAAALASMERAEPEPAMQAEVWIAAGIVQRELNRYEMAFDYLHRAASRAPADTSRGSYLRARSYEEISRTHSTRRDSTAAITWGRKAIDVLAGLDGNHHRELAGVYRAMGWSFIELADYEQAEIYLRRALHIAATNLGPRHRQVASIMNSLGWLAVVRGQHAEAERHLLQGLEIAADTVGENTHVTAALLMNLASLQERQGQFSEAMSTQRRALTIATELGEGARELRARMLHNIGQGNLTLGDVPEAIRVLREAKAANEALQGADTEDSAQTEILLANALLADGKLESARPLIDHAARIYRETYTDSHPNMALVYDVQANYWRAAGDLPRAIGLLERVAALKRLSLGEQHGKTVKALLALSEAQLDAQAYDGAEQRLDQAAAGLADIAESQPESIRAKLIELQLRALRDDEDVSAESEQLAALIEQHFPARKDLLVRLP